METPVATYRIQFNKDFNFESLEEILPYLEQLGISHVYASPIFKARKGSAHGYDIIDHNRISDELGGVKGFDNLAKKLAVHKLKLIQDIVPNHVAYSLENKIVIDLLRNGADSNYRCFLDVDWNHPVHRLKGKILAPFLDAPYEECLKQGEISLAYKDEFKIKYRDIEFPVNDTISKSLLKDTSTEATIRRYNNNRRLLDDLLLEQFFTLAYWKTAFKQINYRRFFDIIDLIGLRMEDPNVFKETHRLIFSLVKAGKIAGLRVDHIDGLFKPKEYLQRLRSNLSDAYLIVEKILSEGEVLPEVWPVEGTTGYDFLAHTNTVFVKDTNEREIDTVYKKFTGNTQTFSELSYKSKKHIIENFFLGDVRNLARLFFQSLQILQYGGDFNRLKLVEAVSELLACFQVYRTYLEETNTRDDCGHFKEALKLASEKNENLADEFAALDFLFEKCPNSPDALHAVMRLQQFTGSIMAKGFEDTALYRYTRLISLNEVGGNPQKFGASINSFHEFNKTHLCNWPLSLNATGTHDTKRGEDARARLNVLSEIPSEFNKRICKWAELNKKLKTIIKNKPAPDSNEEYYIYQTLICAHPFLGEEAEFEDRLKTHLVKALREAKINSNWISPDLDYEEAVIKFTVEALNSKQFMKDFLPFQKKIAFYGFFNSLSQTLLKIASPGIPDFYQGTELWDLNLVDPDNRRPVDFRKRQELLLEISKPKPQMLAELLENYKDGKAKLYIINRSLQFRRKAKSLFEEGAYVPLKVEGEKEEHVISFCRQKKSKHTIVVAPRFPASLVKYPSEWKKIDWKDTYISIPDIESSSLTNILTEKNLKSKSGKIFLKDTLSDFPVALLFGE